MTSLRETYRELGPIVGEDIEPFASVELVDRYRQFMKPDVVRVVLLAESHVFTNDADRAITLPRIPELPGYPTEYARFVYCLAYGEPQLTLNAHHPKRDGTPQFWKIFYSCLNLISDNASFQPVLGTTPFALRMMNKINLLKSMKDDGIWLVDTSIVALYNGGRKVQNMFPALRTSWECHTKHVVMSAQPESVICIGKGVDTVVGNDLRRSFNGRYRVIEQPNAFLKSDQHIANYRRYTRLCRS